MSQGEEDPGWSVKLKRGAAFHPLVDYIVLAEFDIDTGSTVRHQYPSTIPDYKVDWFAEFMLPEGAHNRDVDYTYIFLNRDAPHVDQQFWSKRELGETDKHLLYGINLVKTRHDSSVRRGAIVKAMCLFSQYQFVEILKQPLDLALEKYFDNPNVSVLAELFDSLNAVSLAHLPRADALERSMMKRGPGPHNWYATVDYLLHDQRIPLRVPLYRSPDEVGDIYCTLLVKTFGDQTMRIFHSILTKQRVLFVGHNHAASEVAQMVLSATAMLAPPMSSLIRRTFPYSNLSDLSFLEVPGYVAGVTNPMFQQHEKWWDLLCVLDLPNGTGHITSAEERQTKRSVTPPPNGVKHRTTYEETMHYQADNKFVKGVISGINQLVGEDWVRRQFADYTSNILHLALDHQQQVAQAPALLGKKRRKVMEANLLRVETILAVCDSGEIPAHPWVWCGSGGGGSEGSGGSGGGGSGSGSGGSGSASSAESAEVEGKGGQGGQGHSWGDDSQQLSAAERERELTSVGLLLRMHIRCMQCEVGLDSVEMQLAYQHLESHLQSEQSLQAMLTLLPEDQGGLSPVAIGLFHKSPLIRLSALRLVRRVAQFPSTRSAYESLGGFFHSAFERQTQWEASGALQQEIDLGDSGVGVGVGVDVGIVMQEEEKGLFSPLIDAFDGGGSLTSLIQNTLTLIAEPDYDQGGFSETIDELDLLR